MNMSLSVAPTLQLEAKPKCELCGQHIAGDEKRQRATVRRQIERLDPKCGWDQRNPCIVCQQFVSDKQFHSRSYMKRVEKHVGHLKTEKAKFDALRAKMEADRDWPADTKSLVGVLFVGFCPACPEEPESEMSLVEGDYYECPKCRLQVKLEDGVVILPQKGLAEYKEHARHGHALDNPAIMMGLKVIEDLRGQKS